MKQNSHFTRTRRASSGFTLVELLVVVTIIIVLAGVGYPTIGKMRASAARSECVSRLRGWGVVMAAYAADHDGRVEWRQWASIGWNPDSTSVYLDYFTSGTVDLGSKDDSGSHQTLLRMRTCPAVKTPPAQNALVSYATIRPNAAGVLEPNVSTFSLAKVNNPARFMLMVEALPASNAYLSSGGEFTTRVKPLTQKGPSLRHNGPINALFADYSVQTMTWKQVERGLNWWTTF